MSVKITRLSEAEKKIILGGPIRMVFTPETANTKNFLFAIGYFKPGEGLKAHLHPESEEVYYVTEGTGTVYLGKEREEVQIEPEMAIYIPPGLIHQVKNTGKENLVICFFVAPGKEESVEV